MKTPNRPDDDPSAATSPAGGPGQGSPDNSFASPFDSILAEFSQSLEDAENGAINTVVGSLEELGDTLAGALGESAGALSSLVDSADARSSQALSDVRSALGEIITGAERPIKPTEDAVERAGVDYPFSVWTMKRELDNPDPTPMLERLSGLWDPPDGTIPVPGGPAPDKPKPPPTPPTPDSCETGVCPPGWSGGGVGSQCRRDVTTDTLPDAFDPALFPAEATQGHVYSRTATGVQMRANCPSRGMLPGLSYLITFARPVEPTQPVPPIPPPPEPAPPGTSCPAPPVCCPDPVVNVSVTVPPISPPPQPTPTPAPGEPKAPDESPNLGKGAQMPGWGTSIVCSTVKEMVDAAILSRTTIPAEITVPDFVSWLRSDALDTIKRIPGVSETYPGIDSPEVLRPAVADDLAKRDAASVYIQSYLAAQRYAAIPDPVTAGAMMAILAGAGWAERVTGSPATYLAQSATYLLQYSNPQYIPHQSDVDALANTGRITLGDWECLTRANGNLPHWAEKVRAAGTRQFSPDEVISLHRRGAIDSDGLIQGMVRAGVDSKDKSDLLYRLSEQLPFQSDLLRFMVRDSFDETVVRKYGYDTDFDKKLLQSPQALAFANAIGVPVDTFRYFWRAHWEIPSPTQLYQMLHRLRPDRDEVAAWDASPIPDDGSGFKIGLGPRPPVVTVADVREALKVDDKAPGWIEALINVSYHPITRTDAIRAHSIGSFTDKQLYDAYLDNGYAPGDARLLTDFNIQQKRRTLSSATGVLSLRKIASHYKSGGMNYDDALAATLPLMGDPGQAATFLLGVDRELTAENRANAIKNIRRAVLVGEFAAPDAAARLRGLGVDEVRIGQLLERWIMDRDYRLKEPTARMLCQWRDANIITDIQHRERLLNLGYSRADANRIANTCDTARVVRTRKEAEKVILRDKRELQRIERERKAAEKEAEKKKKEAEKEAGKPK